MRWSSAVLARVTRYREEHLYVKAWYEPSILVHAHSEEEAREMAWRYLDRGYEEVTVKIPDDQQGRDRTGDPSGAAWSRDNIAD